MVIPAILRRARIAGVIAVAALREPSDDARSG
jgi:hypothetical protein